MLFKIEDIIYHDGENTEEYYEALFKTPMGKGLLILDDSSMNIIVAIR